MSLYHEVFQGESFSEDNYFEAVRYVLGPEYSNLSENELEDVLLSRVDLMSESEAEGFWSSLGNVASNIGSGVLRGVSAVAPIVGTAVGTYFGAPQIGGAVGGLVSNLAGSASTALDNNRQQQQRRPAPPQQQRRPANNNNYRRRQAPSPVGQAWSNTTRYLADAGRAALPAIQQYVQDNPVVLRPQAAQDIGRVQGLYNQLGGVINNPQFQAGQAQQSLGTASPNSPIESHSFAELIESVNYLTENILYEYYNGGLIPTEDYYVDQYGQFVGTNTPNRINRLENSIANL
ncbi:hypothetical protein [Flavobacterium geliluteum]|uniref:Uncharacterized protein n=1 Tax=Flavobacterium geliluteum TaxID=2816120 RepID=A0A940X5P7_9FLAO|nr:hypothetical protein [Flavobacterium geliluteum]MBP4136924.1 hypothetical protein [Flavobacterium geliluteum]